MCAVITAPAASLPRCACSGSASMSSWPEKKRRKPPATAVPSAIAISDLRREAVIAGSYLTRTSRAANRTLSTPASPPAREAETAAGADGACAGAVAAAFAARCSAAAAAALAAALRAGLALVVAKTDEGSPPGAIRCRRTAPSVASPIVRVRCAVRSSPAQRRRRDPSRMAGSAGGASCARAITLRSSSPTVADRAISTSTEARAAPKRAPVMTVRRSGGCSASAAAAPHSGAAPAPNFRAPVVEKGLVIWTRQALRGQARRHEQASRQALQPQEQFRLVRKARDLLPPRVS
mmetsp:Transcript_40406/g.130830  ORF Transcript_40406/g.130830 Transcript_40406/m.130830 type:complete len:293 (+) Transcript_40406:487-1365(+)